MWTALSRLAARIAATVRPDRVDRDLEQELDSHLAMLEEENRQRRGLPLVDAFFQDVRYGARALRRNRGVTAACVLSLALGIGANTAIFSVVRTVLLQPLDYPDPDRLVHLARGVPGDPPRERTFSLQRLEELTTDAESYTGLGGYVARPEDVTISGGGEPEVLDGARVSANVLDILRVRPASGRGFLPDEDTAGAPAVAMISAELWRRRFQGDASLVGTVVNLNATPHTIVGVLPDGFQFPFPDIDVWLPHASSSSTLEVVFRRALVGFGRMKPGISLEQARSELHVLDQRYAAAHPERPDSGPLGISTLQGQITARVRTLLWMLLGAVGFVLLIACANVANLLTARATSRTGEFAIRTALGAAPGRLVRQLLTESVVLATAGGALGLCGAAFGLRALLAMPGLELPRAEEVRVDAAVLGFTIAISIGTGLLFGVLPAWQAVRPSRMDWLRRGPSGRPIPTRRGGPSGPPESSVSRSRFGIPSRSLLVVGQVAVSIVLVVGAALLVKSLIRLAAVDPGFQHAGLLTMRVPLPLDQYDTPARRAAFFDALAQRVEEVPGVTGAAVSRTLPTTLGTLATNVQIVGQLIPEPGHLGMAFQAVTPGYFSVLGIPLKRGREFTDRDNVTGARPVAIINERFARRFWPEYPQGEDPVGQQLGVPYLRAGRLEIVGIAGDVLERGLTVESEPQFYVPNVLSPPTTAYVSIRTDGDPLRVVGGIRAAARQIDDGRAVADLRMMDERFGSSVGQRYAAAQLLGTFAGVALLLAMVGIYGVVAHSVVRRAQEIGIRRALGAQPHAILALVVGEGMRLTLAGVACGLAGAFVLTRVMTSLLFDVSATDPATFAGVAMLVVLVAGLAALLPAWRAARIDPEAILRA